MKGSMNWEAAYKALGVKPGAPIADVRRAYISLAKRTHPDVPGGSEEAFQRINEAYAVIKAGRQAKQTGKPFRAFKKEYDELRRLLSPGSLDYGELQEADLALTLKYKNDDEKLENLRLARELIADQINLSQEVRERLRRIRVKTARRVLRTDEERVMERLQKVQQELAVKEGLHQLREGVEKRLGKVVKHVKIIGRKAHIPIVDRINGKKVVRYALITAGILSAIAAGAWVFSKKEQAFTAPPKLLEAKK